MVRLVCPGCRHRIPEAEATRCPACGMKLQRAKTPLAESDQNQGHEADRTPGRRLRPRKKKSAEASGLSRNGWIGLIAGGIVGSFLLIGGVAFLLVRKSGPVSPAGVRYAVVDALPAREAPAVAEEPVPLDDEGADGKGNRDAVAAKGKPSRPTSDVFRPGATPRPAPVAADRSRVTPIRLRPPAAWAVKPGAVPSRPAGPLPEWPDAFGVAEGAVLTEVLAWHRYDLNTGEQIGEPIDLWAGAAPRDRPGRTARHTAALTGDGKQFALVDPFDRTRVDVWDSGGQRLLGLRPYHDAPILWIGWSSGGKLLTADSERLSGWDGRTGVAAFEIEGQFDEFTLAPGAEWVMVTTRARHLYFVDASTGHCLGHVPASRTCPQHTLSPDGKTLLQLGSGTNMQVWDLQTGQRTGDSETPLVPWTLALPDRPGQNGKPPAGPVPDTEPREPGLRLWWIGSRRVLCPSRGAGDEPVRHHLYDLDMHTHTYRYDTTVPTLRTDARGRVWMSRRIFDTGRQMTWEVWVAPPSADAAALNRPVPFRPGSTVRVEVAMADYRAIGLKVAERVATALQGRGFEIGKGGWVLRGDVTTGTATTKLTDSWGRSVSVATLRSDWYLLDPEGKEAWQRKSKGEATFDPLHSRHVVVGSRKFEHGGAAVPSRSTFRLDYQGKDSTTAQIEELIDNGVLYGQGQALPYNMPLFLVTTETGYSPLPLEATLGNRQKP